MVECSTRIDSFEDIRTYITHTLSEIELLSPDSYHVSERLLKRGSRPCGVYFCLYGPRDVRLTAIWETDQNTILFYSSGGQRVKRTRLLEAPRLEDATLLKQAG